MKEGHIVYPERAFQKLTDIQRKLIMATTLGDGHIRFFPRTGFGYFSTAGIQSSYILWKSKLLGNLTSRKIGRRRSYRRPIDGNDSSRFQTCSNKEIGKIYNLIYEGGRPSLNYNYLIKATKRITLEILAILDSFMLAIWYQDDGSFDRGMAKLACYGFPSSDRELLRSWLEERFPPYIGLTKRGQIVFNRRSTLRFLDEIRSYVLPCFNYKLGGLKSEVT